MRTRALTIIPKTQPTRFEAYRQEAATRATLEMASSSAKQAKELAGRAESLLSTASVAMPDHRDSIRVAYMNALRDAYELLGEVIGELDD